MGIGPQYIIAQLDENGVPQPIGADNPLYIEGGGGGGSAFPATSPDGNTTVQLLNNGFRVTPTTPAAGLFQFTMGNGGFNFTPLGMNTLVTGYVAGADAGLAIQPSGGGTVTVAGQFTLTQPATQAGTPTLDNHVATKKYVDDAIAAAIAAL